MATFISEARFFEGNNPQIFGQKEADDMEKEKCMIGGHYITNPNNALL